MDLLMFKPTVRYHQLLVLREISRDPKASQRSLARAAGVSACAINGYIRELRKGLAITATGDSNRTIRYELTPRGELYLAAYENELAEDLQNFRTVSAWRRA